MKNSQLAKWGVGYAVLAFAYTGAITFLLNHAQQWLGRINPGIAPMAFLLLFVVSAAIMGLLVFGRPIMMYLDGQKKEAIMLLFWILGSLVILTIAVFVISITAFSYTANFSM